MDRGKQGVKRSLLTEAAGIPLALAIEGAMQLLFCKYSRAIPLG
jgi:hypothetical protein